MAKHPPFKGGMAERFVTFGSVLRGFRLGYGYSDKHRCFIRIDAQGPPWLITLAPNGGIPSKFMGSKEHAAWWDSEESRQILDTIKPLENVRGVKRVVNFQVDYEGNLV